MEHEWLFTSKSPAFPTFIFKGFQPEKFPGVKKRQFRVTVWRDSNSKVSSIHSKMMQRRLRMYLSTDPFQNSTDQNGWKGLPRIGAVNYTYAPPKTIFSHFSKRPKSKTKTYSNHPFSGAFFAVFRGGNLHWEGFPCRISPSPQRSSCKRRVLEMLVKHSIATRVRGW